MTTLSQPGWLLVSRYLRRVVLLLLSLSAGGMFYDQAYAEGEGCEQGADHGEMCRNLNVESSDAAPAGMVRIDLTRCEDGTVARWHPGSAGLVTFKINDWIGVTGQVVRAVREGTLQWNRAQPFYALKEVTSRDADIVIEVFDQVFPGIVGAAKVKCVSGQEGIRAAAVYLGVKGILPLGVRNMTAHEIGHALGLGHTDKNHDLMDAHLAEKGVDARAICPSNLDRGGLIAGFHSYAMPREDWVEIKCPTQIRG